MHLVNGEDKRRANLQIAETLVNALTSAFEAAPDAEAAVAAAKAQANSAGALDEAPLFGRSPRRGGARARGGGSRRSRCFRPRSARFEVPSGGRPAVPRERRPRARARPRDVQGRAQGPAGAPQQAGDGDVPEAHPAHDHVRRLGRRGQGRQHQARGPSARRPRLYPFFPVPPPRSPSCCIRTCALLDASAEAGHVASTTAAGTVACSWSASKVSLRCRNGRGRTTRSTNSSAIWCGGAPSC